MSARTTAAARLAGSRALWLAVSLSVLLYALWPTFRIRFGVVDDHEIVDVLGGRPRLPLADLPTTVLDRTTESLGRFRPVYWTGRALEAATAGDNPTWWYVDRFVLAAIALTAVYLTLTRFTHPATAAAISLLPFVGPQAETWFRLGPNEAYAVPLLAVGTALVVAGVASGTRPADQWFGFALLLASGLAKESFILVAVIVIAWAGIRFGARRWRAVDVAVLGAAALVALLDVAVLLHRVSAYSGVYPQQRTPGTAASWLGYALSSLTASGGLLAAVLATLVVAVVLDGGPTRRTWLELGALATALVVSQAVFYAGTPAVDRYLYPLAFLPVLVWGAAAATIGRRPIPGRPRVLATTAVLVAVGVLVLGGVLDTRTSAGQMAETTIAFQTSLDDLEHRIRADHVHVVVLQPHRGATDTEPTLALARYLTTRTEVTAMTLPADGPVTAEDADTPATLRAWSRDGFSRLSPYRPTQNCLSVVFGDADPVCPTAVPAPH